MNGNATACAVAATALVTSSQLDLAASVPRTPPRQPLVPFAAAAIIGIVLDHHLRMPLHFWLSYWILPSLLLFLLLHCGSTLGFGQTNRIRSHQVGLRWLRWLGVWWLTLLLAAGWHHLRQFTLAEDDISTFLAEGEAQLVRLRGQIVSTPVWRGKAPTDLLLSWRPNGSTSFRLQVLQVQDRTTWLPASGLIACYIGDRGEAFASAGEAFPQVLALRRGMTVEIFGWLDRPKGPMNRGEWDHAEFLARQHIFATLNTESDAGIRLVRNTDFPWYDGFAWRDCLLADLDHRLTTGFSPKSAALIKAILLGDQTDLAPADTEPFLHSGTLHLLVVSGTHVGIVVYFFWLGLSWLGFALHWRASCCLLGVCGYAFLTGGESPVLRAAVLTCLWLVSLLCQRRIQPLNSLAGAVLFLTLLSPVELLRSGTQLSFLAVLAGSLLGGPLLRRWSQPQPELVWNHWLAWRLGLTIAPRSLAGSTSMEGEALFALIPKSPIGHLLDKCCLWGLTFALWFTWLCWNAFILSIAIGIAIGPLILYHFHLLTPAGLWATPIVFLAMNLAMLTSTIYLLVSLCLPAAWYTGLGMWCEWPVRWLSISASWAEQQPGSHFYLPALPLWWLIGFYLLLFGPWLWPSGRRWGRWHLVGISGWVCSATLFWQQPSPPTDLEYHQLAVGHGLCGVFRFPDGQVLMVDCGSLRGGSIARKTVVPWLWAHGIGRLDAILLSHADLDHFSGMAPLMELIPVGKIYLTPVTARSREPGLATLRQTLIEKKVPLQWVGAGDVWQIGQTKLEILLPTLAAVQTPSKRTDNAQSVVLRCEHRGVSLLSTGDLEKEGLDELLTDPRAVTDILIAPHHGSKSSNDSAVAKWLRPRFVLSSQGYARTPDPLDHYRKHGAQVFCTYEVGTISCYWRADGVHLQTYRPTRGGLLLYPPHISKVPN